MIHRNLKALRIKNGINQSQMAKELNLCLSTYSQKETGKKDFTLSEAKKIALVFNMSIDDIFFDEKVIEMKTLAV